MHAGQWNALIKRYQPALMGNRQRQQIQVGELARAVNALPGKDFLIAQGNFVRPEFVVALAGKFPIFPPTTG